MRILHAIHDFLPRHQAGSEIYAFELCRAQAANHDVSVLCGEYDPSRQHGHVTWRVHEGLPVIEVVNNWICAGFADSYRSPIITDRIMHVLRATRPEVVHVHNLLNLSFDLPAMARASGAAVVATLHDYTLVCPSGGQRIHRADEHLCTVIDADRCARCFDESPVRAMMSFGKLAAATRAPGLLHRAAVELRSRLPNLAGEVSRALPRRKTTRADVEERLAAARRVFDSIDLFVAPSRSIADEFRELGVSGEKIRISDYGCQPLRRCARNGHEAGHRLRIGYVGTLVWHKGVHNLIDAVRGLPPNTYELKIFGDTSVFADYTAGLRARAEGLPVVFMGAFDRRDAAETYAEIDVLAAPSLWLENSPLVIHEAFMAGVPVVGSRIGGIAELIDEGRTGLFHDPASTSELRERLRELIDQPQRLIALTEGVRAIPRIKTIDADAGEWERRYADLVRRQEPVGPTL